MSRYMVYVYPTTLLHSQSIPPTLVPAAETSMLDNYNSSQNELKQISIDISPVQRVTHPQEPFYTRYPHSFFLELPQPKILHIVRTPPFSFLAIGVPTSSSAPAVPPAPSFSASCSPSNCRCALVGLDCRASSFSSL